MKKFLFSFFLCISFLLLSVIFNIADAACTNWQNNCTACSAPVNGTQTCTGIDDTNGSVCTISQTCNRPDDRDSCDCGTGMVGNYWYNRVSCTAGSQCIGVLGPNGSGRTCHYCATPVCNDNGEQDGDETGVDCGGSVCAACTVTPTPIPATPTPSTGNTPTPGSSGGACDQSCGTCGFRESDGSCSTNFGCCHRVKRCVSNRVTCFTQYDGTIGDDGNECDTTDPDIGNACGVTPPPSTTITPTPTTTKVCPPQPYIENFSASCDASGNITVRNSLNPGFRQEYFIEDPADWRIRYCRWSTFEGDSDLRWDGKGCGTLNPQNATLPFANSFNFARGVKEGGYGNPVVNIFNSGVILRGRYVAQIGINWEDRSDGNPDDESTCRYGNIDCNNRWGDGNWYTVGYDAYYGANACEGQNRGGYAPGTYHVSGYYIQAGSVQYSCDPAGNIELRYRIMPSPNNPDYTINWYDVGVQYTERTSSHINHRVTIGGERATDISGDIRDGKRVPAGGTVFSTKVSTGYTPFRGTAGQQYRVTVGTDDGRGDCKENASTIVTCGGVPTSTPTPTPTPALSTVTVNVRDDIGAGCVVPVAGVQVSLNGTSQPTDALGSRTFTSVPIRPNNLVTMSLLGNPTYQNHRVKSKSITPSTSATSILGGYSFATPPNRTITYCLTNIQPWFQTTSGDVKMPEIKIPVPVGKAASVPQLGSDASIFISSAGVGTFLPGVSSNPWRWVVEQEYSYSANSSNRQGTLSYSFFNSLPQSRGIVIHDLLTSPAASCTGIAPNYTCDINFNNPDPSVVSGIYRVVGNLTIQNYQHRAGFGFQIVLVASGTITILNPSGGTTIVVPKGANNSLVIAAKEDLIFHPSVGSTDPANTDEHVQGIFSAERDIIVRGDGCPNLATGGTPDRRLNIGGGLIANAAAPFAAPGYGGVGNGRFINERSLCSSDKDFPSVKVVTRPDFIINHNIDLTTKLMRWQEVKP